MGSNDFGTLFRQLQESDSFFDAEPITEWVASYRKFYKKLESSKTRTICRPDCLPLGYRNFACIAIIQLALDGSFPMLKAV
jgi:hypothetical protein